MPPPIIKGTSTDFLTALIIASEIGFLAPLPPSININFRPSISPAIAVQAATVSLSAGIGLVLLIYETVVGFPLSTSM